MGGESTRPYADSVSLDEELERVVPVIEGLAGLDICDENGTLLHPVISVDTYKAEVAARALDAGADIVNDVSAFAFDPGLLDVLAQYAPGYVLMHSLGRPEDMQDAPSYKDVVDEILAFFEQKLEVLDKAGLPKDRIVLDPGIGFGKLLEHNLAILRNLERFKVLGLPIYMGLSNKSLWQGFWDWVSTSVRMPRRRYSGTAMKCGIHRVHEVKFAQQTLTIVQEIA